MCLLIYLSTDELTLPVYLFLFTASADGTFAILRQDHLDIRMRSWDDMHRRQFTDAVGSGSAGIRCGFHRAHITAYHHRHISATDIFTADQRHICGFDHRIGG